MFNKGGNSTTESEAVRTALQGLVGCAGAAAGGGDCGSAATGAAASVVINNLISAIDTGFEEPRYDPITEELLNPTALEDQQARTNLVATIIGAIAVGAGLDTPDAVTAAQIETENNAEGASGKQVTVEPISSDASSEEIFEHNLGIIQKLQNENPAAFADLVDGLTGNAEEVQRKAAIFIELGQERVAGLGGRENVISLLNTASDALTNFLNPNPSRGLTISGVYVPSNDNGIQPTRQQVLLFVDALDQEEALEGNVAEFIDSFGGLDALENRVNNTDISSGELAEKFIAFERLKAAAFKQVPLEDINRFANDAQAFEELSKNNPQQAALIQLAVAFVNENTTTAIFTGEGSFGDRLRLANDEFDLVTRGLGLVQGVFSGGAAIVTGTATVASVPVCAGTGVACLGTAGLGILTAVEADQSLAGFRTFFSGESTNSFLVQGANALVGIDADKADIILGLGAGGASIAVGVRSGIKLADEGIENLDLSGSFRNTAEISDELLAAARVNTTAIAGRTCVYICVIDGVTRYVGITVDVVRKGAEHLTQKGIRIREIRGLSNLTRADAKAVEQTLINFHGFGNNGGTLFNRINSISEVRKPTAYEQSLLRGAELLKNAGYPGF